MGAVRSGRGAVRGFRFRLVVGDTGPEDEQAEGSDSADVVALPSGDRRNLESLGALLDPDDDEESLREWDEAEVGTAEERDRIDVLLRTFTYCASPSARVSNALPIRSRLLTATFHTSSPSTPFRATVATESDTSAASDSCGRLDPTRDASVDLGRWFVMAALSIRNLDDDVKHKLHLRAADHGRSMEAEVRSILEKAVSERESAGNLFTTLLDCFGALGGVELDVPDRATPARAADFDS